MVNKLIVCSLAGHDSKSRTTLKKVMNMFIIFLRVVRLSESYRANEHTINLLTIPTHDYTVTTNRTISRVHTVVVDTTNRTINRAISLVGYDCVHTINRAINRDRIVVANTTNRTTSRATNRGRHD